MSRLTLALACLSLIGCDAKGGGAADTDLVFNDDVDGDTDAADTDAPDTDVQDTDVQDTDAPITYAQVPYVHAGIYTLGMVLHFHELVVTAVRYRATPPASNGVIVQDPAYADNAGIYIDLDNRQDLPDLGDVVEFVGVYEEDPVGGTGVDALSTIIVDPADPGAWLMVTGTADLPDPVVLTLDELVDPLVAEDYESMRVQVAGPLSVMSNPNGYGEVNVALSGAGTQARLSPRFYDLGAAVPDLGTGDAMSSLSGVLFWERSTYKIATTARADAAGFVDN